VRSSNALAGAAENSVAAEPLKVRGRFLTAVVLPVTGTLDDVYYASLDALLQQSPGFFSDAPVILDIAHAKGLESEDDFVALLAHLRLRNLTPIGMQNATEGQKEAAFRAGLTTLESGRDTPLMKKSRPPAAAPMRAEPPPAAVLVTEPVRSGQRIVAEGGDLVVVASVSSGAELIAHGNIHVYGILRGRALAGIHGDKGARIFCQSLEAELVAIAGLYKTSEALGAAAARQRVQVFLVDDTLRIESLK
jgi:septum site-determining protein MinC